MREETEIVELIMPSDQTGVLRSDNGEDERNFGLLKALGVGVGLALGVVAISNALVSYRTGPPKLELEGVFARYPARHGDLAYTVSGSGSPLLLLHDPCIGGSMAEWENNFAALARRHTVYSFDFLGWGLSDKPAHRYDTEDFVEQIRYFVDDVIGEPCAVVASGRSGVFALEAAHRAPELFTKFVLVCPTSPELDEIHEVKERLLPLLQLPLLGTSALNWMTSRARIEARLQNTQFYDKSRVDEALVNRVYTAAHQPGAQHGTAALLAGALDMDWHEAWSHLQAPALIVWGRNTLGSGLETAPEWLALAPAAELKIIDNAMLRPHIEQADEWNNLVQDWLKD